MSTESKGAEAPKRPTGLYELKGRGKIEISKTLAAQINELHKEISDKEWSGVLVYRVINGDINKTENFHVIAEGLLPMDVGTSGYTEYEADESILDVYDHYPKLSPEENTRNIWRIGQIHTHHSMGAFFSGTDIDELRENAGKYPYYLSLIVDFKCNYKAKVAFVAEKNVASTTKISFNSGRRLRNLFERKEENITMLVTFDLDVKFQNESWFSEKISQLKKKPTKSGSYNNYTPGNSHKYNGSSHSPVAPLGFKQSQLKISNDETEENANKKMEKRKFWDKLRVSALKLLEVPGKPFIKTDNWYLILDSLLSMCIDDIAISDHMKIVNDRFDNWLTEEFQTEMYAGKDEQDVILELMSTMNTYSNRNKVAIALGKLFRERWDKANTGGKTKEDTDQEEDEYYRNIYGSAYQSR